MPQPRPLTLTGVAAMLTELGYPKTFVEKLLPSWWEASAAATSAGALEYALILKERLGLRLSFSQEGKLQVSGDVPGAKFKKRVTTPLTSLATSSRLGAALGRTALRAAPSARSIPADPQELNRAIVDMANGQPVTLETITRYCWRMGIPVVHLQLLPNKAAKMAGMVVRHQERYAIVLAHAYRENARQAFVIAHELGHIALGHVTADGVLVDDAINAVEGVLRQSVHDSEEQAADEFALKVLRGRQTIPGLPALGLTPAGLAASATRASEKANIDPAHLILSYAHERGDWLVATQAMRFLQGASEAASVLQAAFEEEADVAKLTDDELDYLRRMQTRGGVAP